MDETENDSPNRFDRDTAVTPISPDRYAARIDTGWWVVRGPNGGYVAAILQRAVSLAVGDPERLPRSLTVHYTAPPREGEATIETRVERAGRSLSTATARLLQGDRLCALALAACSTSRQGPDFRHAVMPEVPRPEDLDVSPAMIPIHQRYEVRFVPTMRPHAGADTAVTAAWIRPAEPRPLDALLLAAYTDALPPAAFALARAAGELGPLPTVDLTIHYRTAPAEAEVGPGDACLAIFRSRLAHAGYIEEDGEIWSPGGQLLAQSRQLAVVLG